jgi:hypothetical protein
MNSRDFGANYRKKVKLADPSWTHNICVDCWKKRYTSRPTAIQGIPEEVCCFCGKANSDGVFIRADPSTLLCKHNQSILVTEGAEVKDG